MDFFWFFFMVFGFFMSFVGFIGGKYYLMMKFGIEVFWLYEVEEIIEKGILLLIGVGVLGRIFLSMEEFYEMKLVMKFVEEGCDVIEEVYFVILYLISFEG